IDWLKTDSQGTDLRIVNSLRPDVRSRLLAVDIEPGLIDAYAGEDLFTEAHQNLSQQGFWLSNLNVQGTVRMRIATLREFFEKDKDLFCKQDDQPIRRSPCWCEARYLRTLNWLTVHDFTRRDYVVLWTFALLDKQAGFALDVGKEYERV